MCGVESVPSLTSFSSFEYTYVLIRFESSCYQEPSRFRNILHFQMQSVLVMSVGGTNLNMVFLTWTPSLLQLSCKKTGAGTVVGSSASSSAPNAQREPISYMQPSAVAISQLSSTFEGHALGLLRNALESYGSRALNTNNWCRLQTGPCLSHWSIYHSLSYWCRRRQICWHWQLLGT